MQQQQNIQVGRKAAKLQTLTNAAARFLSLEEPFKEVDIQIEVYIYIYVQNDAILQARLMLV